MKILVVGAAGGVGRALVEQAVARAHEVTAFVRDASNYRRPEIRVVAGDARDPRKMSEAVSGQDAVVNAIGGKTPWTPTGLDRDVGQAIVQALHRHHIRRLVVASVMGAGDSSNVADYFCRWIFAPTFLRGAVKDKTEMERYLAQTDIDWTVARPAVLTNEKLAGGVNVFTRKSGAKAHRIARADVAAFMLDQLTSDKYLKQAVTIATS
jgi:putative NADH-flavin reductase